MGHGQGPGEAPMAYTYGLLDAREQALRAIQDHVKTAMGHATDTFFPFFLDDGILGTPSHLLTA
eukprot:9187209-Karenia_brevis.AAC.1